MIGFLREPVAIVPVAAQDLLYLRILPLKLRLPALSRLPSRLRLSPLAFRLALCRLPWWPGLLPQRLRLLPLAFHLSALCRLPVTFRLLDQGLPAQLEFLTLKLDLLPTLLACRLLMPLPLFEPLALQFRLMALSFNLVLPFGLPPAMFTLLPFGSFTVFTLYFAVFALDFLKKILCCAQAFISTSLLPELAIRDFEDLRICRSCSEDCDERKNFHDSIRKLHFPLLQNLQPGMASAPAPRHRPPSPPGTGRPTRACPAPGVLRPQ